MPVESVGTTDGKGRLGRVWERLRRPRSSRETFWRDVLVAVLFVGLILASVWAYTGQPFPDRAPLVVVESGSMMHGPHGPSAATTPSFGRVGPIDPGDMVFVVKVKDLSDVETLYSQDANVRYGAHGDVIVYNPFGQDGTPIIHRAMLLVTETSGDGCQPTVDCVYVVPGACDPAFADWVEVAAQRTRLAEYCVGTTGPISLHLVRDGLRLRLNDYPCAAGQCDTFYSSIVTKGDNNPSSDQGAESPSACRSSSDCISAPIREEWVLGKARGEVPWFGLVKLAFYGNPNYQPGSDPTRGANWRILGATAPWDIWSALLICIAALFVVPLVADALINQRRKMRATEDSSNEDPPKSLGSDEPLSEKPPP